MYSETQLQRSSSAPTKSSKNFSSESSVYDKGYAIGIERDDVGDSHNSDEARVGTHNTITKRIAKTKDKLESLFLNDIYTKIVINKPKLLRYSSQVQWYYEIYTFFAQIEKGQ